MGFLARTKHRLTERFEQRLREGDDALGFWAWTALSIIGLAAFSAFSLGQTPKTFGVPGGVLALILVAAALALLAATSPAWAATLAMRRHRRRVASRTRSFGAQRDLADQLYALGRAPEALYREQRGLLDSYLGGVGPGDAARVASTWCRLVGSTVLMLGLIAVGFVALATFRIVSFSGLQGIELALGSVVGIVAPILLGLGSAVLLVAAGLGAAAKRDIQLHVDIIKAGHGALLEESRKA